MLDYAEAKEKHEAEYKQLIHYCTFERIDLGDTEQKKRFDDTLEALVRYRMDLENELNTAGNGGVKSETVGTQKVEYHSIGYAEKLSLKDLSKTKEYQIIKSFWGHTGLMYRGGGSYVD